MPRRIFAYFLHKNKKKKQDHTEASIHLERAYIYSILSETKKLSAQRDNKGSIQEASFPKSTGSQTKWNNVSTSQDRC
jgi:hypothetical protein